MGFYENGVNRNFLRKTMVRTRASEVAFFFAHPRSCQTHDPFQDAQGTKSNLEVVMEDIRTNDTTDNGSDSRGPIKETYSTTDVEDDNLIYGQERFRRNKAQRHYNFYYWDRRVIVE